MAWLITFLMFANALMLCKLPSVYVPKLSWWLALSLVYMALVGCVLTLKHIS